MRKVLTGCFVVCHPVGCMAEAFSRAASCPMVKVNAHTPGCTGATFDLMDDRHFEEFEELPEHAWASLNEQDRRMIKQRVTDWDR